MEPHGLGYDNMLDGFALACYDGDMGACDFLYEMADWGSTYEFYGDTCAGRQPAQTGIYCLNNFEVTT